VSLHAASRVAEKLSFISYPYVIQTTNTPVLENVIPFLWNQLWFRLLRPLQIHNILIF